MATRMTSWERQFSKQAGGATIARSFAYTMEELQEKFPESPEEALKWVKWVQMNPMKPQPIGWLNVLDKLIGEF